MGDYIYAISHGGITVTNLDTLEESDSHQFVEYNQEQVFETSESSEQEDNAED